MPTLTPKAAEYAAQLLKEVQIKSPPGGIRFQVKAGGCHGLELIHKLETVDERHDIITLSHGIRMLVDPKSLAQLRNLEIDHTDNLIDKPFVIKGGNTCGCGTSFEPKKKEEKK